MTDLARLEEIARAADPDARHEVVKALFPGGLTPQQYRMVALASTDADGRVDPPAIADWFRQQSLLMGMFIGGEITRKCRRDEPGPWFITDKGRAALKTLEALKP
jgi:hypothetical protein